ncbi:hypothetical protein [Microbacterium sp. gxy059]|uniref:hypothetical protein n=1 Tax=Microbacterium sp. gxy059 TaxID=2957199 RepID=UPI003D99D0EA
MDPDEIVEAAPFAISVTRARVFDELADVFPAEDGMRYIAVMATAENTSDDPVAARVLAQAVALDLPRLQTIALDAGEKIVDPEVLRSADSLPQRTFQPGLPIEVVLAWKQHVAEPVAAEASVVFSEQTWRRSLLDDSWGWRDGEPSSRLTLPLEPLDVPEEEQ